MQEGLISRVTFFPHFLQSPSTSSVHTSFTVSHQKHLTSSGYGVLISLLPGHDSFSAMIYCNTSGNKGYEIDHKENDSGQRLLFREKLNSVVFFLPINML
jgi:hypothetical protein